MEHWNISFIGGGKDLDGTFVYHESILHHVVCRLYLQRTLACFTPSHQLAGLPGQGRVEINTDSTSKQLNMTSDGEKRLCMNTFSIVFSDQSQAQEE